MSRPGFPSSSNSTEHYSFEYRYVASGEVAFSTSGTHDYQSRTADSIGANTPGWPRVKNENAYVGYRTKVEVDASRFTGHISPPAGTEQKGEGTYSTFLLLGGWNPLADFENTTTIQNRDKLAFKLQSKIKDQKINVAQAAAEFDQTCSTVADAAKRIASAIGMVKRGNLRGALGALGGGRRGGGGAKKPGRKPGFVPPSSHSISQDLLALRYGWEPLLSDVDGACEELARTLTYRPPAARVQARVTTTEHQARSFSPINETSPPFTGVRTIKCTSLGVIEYRVASNVAQIAANTGIINPLAVAWEKLPWSFVADWFIPVGTFLQNLDYDIGVEFSRGHMSHKTTASWKVKMANGTYGPSYNNQTWSGGRVEASVEAFQRDILSAFPHLAYPHWKNPLSLKHVENALALLRTSVG